MRSSLALVIATIFFAAIVEVAAQSSDVHVADDSDFGVPPADR